MSIRTIGIILTVLIISGFFAYRSIEKSSNIVVTNFEECAEAGNPVMESYPQQCNHNGQHFVQNIGNELEKMDLIRSDNPRPNAEIESPLMIEGQARGYWFFEGSFPVQVIDSEGRVLGEGFVSAEGEWMTEDFVSFSGVLEFDAINKDINSGGELLLIKDNPSDLRELDDKLTIPVRFK